MKQNKEYFTVVNGYDMKYFTSIEDCDNYIKAQLEKHKDLEPTEITKSVAEYKTFNDKVVNIYTKIYLYKAGYTETFTTYCGEDFNPLGTIQRDLEIQELRKEWQPQLEKDVKEFKKWVNENGWVCKTSSDSVSVAIINHNAKNESGGYVEWFTLGTEERHIIDSRLKTEENKKFMDETLEKFINIEGFLKDILAAF